VADPDAAALVAVRTALEQALERVTSIADARRADEDDPLVPELDDLERAVLAAVRRIERTLRRLQ
jgi:hypothetical protein